MQGDVSVRHLEDKEEAQHIHALAYFGPWFLCCFQNHQPHYLVSFLFPGGESESLRKVLEC